MTVWTRNEPNAALRRCALDIAAITDGSWAPLATSFTGKLKMRAGGTTWAAATGTLTNTGYDGHWVYEATQVETNVNVNEIELRIVDATYYAQTLVEIQASLTVSSITTAILDALLSDHAIVGSVADGIAIAASMLQGNFFMDQVGNSSNGQTAARIRCFRSGAATSAATAGGTGEGEFAIFQVVTTYVGVDQVQTHRVVRQ